MTAAFPGLPSGGGWSGRALGWVAVLAGLCLLTPAVGAQESGSQEPDSLTRFLEDLSKTTDDYFGETTSRFDTTGFDTLLQHRWANPLELPSPNRGYLLPILITRFNRAEGLVLGAGANIWNHTIGTMRANAAYGFSNKSWRYELGWKRILWYKDRYGYMSRRDLSRDWNLPTQAMLGVELHYLRETAKFMPEHARPFTSDLNAFFIGTDRQSFYKRRGFLGLIRFRWQDWHLTGGYRDANEEAMPKTTNFTLFGNDSAVPGVTLADPDDYNELLGGITFFRRDWDLAVSLNGRGLGNAAWRLRGAIAQGFRLWRPIKGVIQIEGGAAEAAAPVQRRFEVGGPAAIPSLGFGVGSTDHLLLGRLELVEAHNLFQALHIPHPDFMDFHAGAFFHYGAVWDDPAGREVVFSKPPSTAWRGTVGLSLVYRPGLPDPRTQWRFQAGWPVGPEGGVMRLTLSIGREFDLITTN
jgi:hypothetical protein